MLAFLFGLLELIDAQKINAALARLFEGFTASPRHARLPFCRGWAFRESSGPVTISLTEKEVKRCLEALDWYIESFAPEMESRGLDVEIGRYEDLMYRLMRVPDKNVPHNVAGRKADRLS